MDTTASDLNLYKIPSLEAIQNRKIFYGLQRDIGESTEKWFDRTQRLFYGCVFPSHIEFLLIDKFVCELNAREFELIQTAKIWSFQQLSEYFLNPRTENVNVNLDKCVDQSIEINLIKLESVSKIQSRSYFY